MKFSTKSRYALEGLFYIALYADKEPVRIKKIAEDTGISVAYLEQIFFILKKSNLLITIRGAKGGFHLGKPATEITIGEIIRAIEPDLAPVDCVHNLDTCKSKVRSHCVSRRFWVSITHTIEDTVDTMTLQDLKEEFILEKGGLL